MTLASRARAQSETALERQAGSCPGLAASRGWMLAWKPPGLKPASPGMGPWVTSVSGAGCGELESWSPSPETKETVSVPPLASWPRPPIPSSLTLPPPPPLTLGPATCLLTHLFIKVHPFYTLFFQPPFPHPGNAPSSPSPNPQPPTTTTPARFWKDLQLRPVGNGQR